MPQETTWKLKENFQRFLASTGTQERARNITNLKTVRTGSQYNSFRPPAPARFRAKTQKDLCEKGTFPSPRINLLSLVNKLQKLIYLPIRKIQFKLHDESFQQVLFREFFLHSDMKVILHLLRNPFQKLFFLFVIGCLRLIILSGRCGILLKRAMCMSYGTFYVLLKLDRKSFGGIYCCKVFVL